MQSVEQARAHVHHCYEKVLAVADGSGQQPLHAWEARTWDLLLALGRALLVLFLVRQVARPRPASYEYGGVRWNLSDWRETELGTRFGKVPFRRPVGRRASSRRAAADLAVDRELGLGSGFSLAVVLGIARLCAMMSFAGARETWLAIYGWAPAPRAISRMIDAIGQKARTFMEDALPPEDDGDVLVIQVDAGGAPMISPDEARRRRKPKRERRPTRRERKAARRHRPHQRRTKGKKSKNAKQAFTAVLYTLRRSEDGELEGPVNKRMISTFESHEALFVWLEPEARKRGYGTKRTLFLADGSEHIWRLQQRYLPEAEPCLDWYHLAEYLWKAGRSFHREGTKALRKWVRSQQALLRADRIDEVLSELRDRLQAIPKTGPGNKGKRERLEQVIGYVQKHRSRMPYAAFLARDFDIGSGSVEGAVRNLIRMRLDGPGRRWGRGRSEYILHLRCILLNGQWDDFRRHLLHGAPVMLAAQPEPARPHAALAVA